MNSLTVAICTYNGSKRLPELVSALRELECPIPSEILIVDNNSTDDTPLVVRALSELEGKPIRYVKETKQGIPHARNRAIAESLGSTYLAFIDDDERPGRHWLKAAIDALDREGAECVGGEIRVRLPRAHAPRWLTEELRRFLGKVENGTEPFWIDDITTPIWSGNVASRTSIFADGLRFDLRYNRKRHGIGGGSDEIMFRKLLERKCRIRYRPDMLIEHYVGPEKLRRRYFLKLHYGAGRKFGQYEAEDYPRSFIGVPPFMVTQALRHWYKALLMFLRREPDTLRQAMNGSYAVGTVVGKMIRWISS